MKKGIGLAFGMGVCLLFLPMFGAFSQKPDAAMRAAVEEDWRLQEARLGRSIDQPDSLKALLERSGRLIADLNGIVGNDAIRSQWDAFSREISRADELNATERENLYLSLRWFTREIALRNPLIADTPLVFMQRHRFICQMLHEYLGYYYDYADIAGGGIFLLKRPGYSMDMEDLIENPLPKGNFTTLSLAYDAKTLYFAYARRAAAAKPNFYSSERQCFHLYALNLADHSARALTSGNEDDFDPCPLPDGGIAFMSTRRGGFTRCNNPWEPLPAHTLHRLDPDGGIKQLSAHETSEWHPQVLNDGRIAYTRWDYVDRSAAHFHGIWVTDPDGSNTRQLFGNYTQQINACYQPHPIPGSQRIAFLAGAHHVNVGGSLVLFDPARAQLDPESGEDAFSSIESLTPEVCFAEVDDQWPDSYYHSPWPLSENYFLISFSFDPLPGMHGHSKKDTETGIYLCDRFGNLELLYRKPGISSMYPIPLRPRPAPPVIPSVLDNTLGDMGEFLLANVYQSHFAFPDGRPVAAIRVFQLLPKSETHVANDPRLGYANAEPGRMLLGEVPVESDGSAYFRAPAHKPLAFQAVDREGRAIQGMRSAVYLQPGERRNCVGCHESTGQTGRSAAEKLLATRRPPSSITPGPDGSHPWSFPRLIQPMIDKHCVTCHDGKGKASPRLGPNRRDFSESYAALRPYVRWYEWGDNSISAITTRPGEMPADMSPLITILQDKHHAGKLSLSDAEWRILYLWLDGNAAFYGAYSFGEEQAQARGEAIPAPELQ